MKIIQTISVIAATFFPFMCIAAESPDQIAAADAVLKVCFESAESGKPVIPNSLAAYFKSDRKGERLTSVKGLPTIVLRISNGQFRCSLIGAPDVAQSAFAVAIREKVSSWPGYQSKETKLAEAVYANQGDASKAIHDVVVIFEKIEESRTWTVMIWDNGLPE